MQYWEITLTIPPQQVQQTADALTCAGFSELVIEDGAELTGLLDEKKVYWDYVDDTLRGKLETLSAIRLYLEASDSKGMRDLRAFADARGLPISAVPLKDENWEESWKAAYPPVEAGEKLVVLPIWSAGTDTHGRIPVLLDPGLTFGTGAHPTTHMVLAEMENSVAPGIRCLDLGSGSGILSIAALRLGAESAVGVDVDPMAEHIARQNAAYNGFSAPRFSAKTGDVLTDTALMTALKSRPFDLVLVNIVADVIIRLAPVLPALVSPDGEILLSGILDSREADVRRALTQAGLTVQTGRAEAEWRCLRAKRR